jgi:hypothetical protein
MMVLVDQRIGAALRFPMPACIQEGQKPSAGRQAVCIHASRILNFPDSRAWSEEVPREKSILFL